MKISETIADDDIIIKYGYTDNLVRRTKEHMDEYGSIKGVKLELMNFAYVDPKYLSQAEVDIKDFFRDIETPLEYKSYKELVVINPKHKRQIKKYYKYMSKEYAGCVRELIEKIEELKREIEKRDLVIENLKNVHLLLQKEKDNENEKNMLNNKLLLKDKDNENNMLNNKLLLKDKDNENNMLKKDNELLKKDMEIEKMKNELLQLKK